MNNGKVALRGLTVIVAVMMSMVFMTTGSFANEPEENPKYSTSSEIVKAMKAEEQSNDGLTDNERTDIVENSTQKAKEDYLELMMDQAVKKINEEDPALENGEENRKEEYLLDCGARVEVTLSDQTENQDDTFTPSSKEHEHLDFQGYKDYGDRKYTATFHAVASYGTWLTFRVINHYTISNKGLRIRSAESDYSNGSYVKRLESDSKIEDASATKDGADINCIGRIKYESQFPIIGATVRTFNAKLRNYVKLVKLEKKNKRAKSVRMSLFFFH